MTSGSSVNEAIINTVVGRSASVFNSASPTGNITMRDYGLLDTTTSGCVYFLLPPSFESEFTAFGEPPEQKTTFLTDVTCYIKDTGSVTEVFSKIYQAERDLDQGLHADANLGGAVVVFSLRRGSGWDGQTFVESTTGLAYIPVKFTIESWAQEV